MAEVVIRANVLPAQGVVTDLWTAVSGIEVLTVVACNYGTLAADIRLTRALAGVADDPSQNLLCGNSTSGEQLPPCVTRELVVGLTATTNDKLRGYSSTGQVAFHVSGLGR